MPRVVVIGGGISGLSAAYYLAKGGAACTLIESRPRLGGVIQTDCVEGCMIEAGPDSFLSVKRAALDLIRELGLEADVIGSNDHLRVTFVRKNGNLVPLPDGLMMMVPTKILPLLTTPLIGWGTKLRMGLELFRAPEPHSGDESVAQFVEEHYGREAVDYLAEPLLSGIYGGDVAKLSVRSVLPRFVELANQYGSLTRGVLAVRAKAKSSGTAAPLFQTLRGGLGQLVESVERAIDGKTTVVRGRAEIVERTDSGYRVRLGEDWLEADELVVATEAHSAAALLVNVDGALADLLATVDYGSSITVALGFDERDLSDPPTGFGFLVPKKERRRLMACTWVGTKFPNRVPEGKIIARCFLGGLDERAFTEPDEAIVNAVTEELREIAGVTAPPRFSRVFRWPRAMAQYPVGHPATVAEIETRVAGLRGLHLAGNAYDGIGIPDCIRLGKRAAERILKG